MSGTIVRLPDGSEIEVPTSDPKQAAAVAKRHWASRQGPKPRTGWQTAGDFLGDTIDNVIPNFGDEIAAIPDAARAAVKGRPIGEAFNRSRREFKQHQAQYDKEHPALAWGSTLAGLGASVALPVGRAVSGARMGVKALQAAKAGALFGAVSGAGEGDGLGDRATNAATSAAIGGAFGAASAPALVGATRAGRFIRRNVPGAAAVARALPNVPKAVMRRPLATARTEARDRADSMIGDALMQGHIATGFGKRGAPATPATVMDEVQRRQSMNVPAVPGDVTQPLRGLTAWASRGMGPGQTMVRERMAERKAEEASRLRQHVVDTLGDVGDPIQQMEAHTRRARSEAAPMYAEAYAQPIVLTPEMRGIAQTPAFQDAVPQAVRNIRNAQRDPEALGFVMGRDGQLLPDQHQFLSTEGFDQVIRAMRDNGRAAAEVNQLTGQVINNTNSVHINRLAGDLRGELAAQNGAYRDVTGMYADELAQRDALEAGMHIGKRTGHELSAWARQAPEDAHPSWAIGARDTLADHASRIGAEMPTANGAAALRKMLGDRSKQDAIQGIMGDQGSVSALQGRLEAEHQAHSLWADIEGNSKTAMRQAADESFDAVAGTGTGRFDVRGLLTAALNNVTAGAGERTKQDVKERIAEFTTASDPEEVRSLMAEVAAKAARDRQFADGLHQAGRVASKVYGANLAPSRPDDLDGGF